MKIMFFAQTGKLGGAERSLLVLMKEIQRHKNKSILVTTEMGPLVTKSIEENINHIFLSSYKFFPFKFIKIPNVAGIMITLLHAYIIIKKNNPDIVHSNTTRMHLTLCALSIIPGFPPVVCHMRWIPQSKPEKLIIYNFLKFFKPNGIHISNASASHFPAVKGKIWNVVYNAVEKIEVSSETVNNLKSKYQLEDRFPIILFPSRIEPWKGQILAINSFNNILEKFPNAALILAGSMLFEESPYLKLIRNTINKNNLNNKVFLIGQIDFIEPWFYLSDFVLHCSLKPEPFGRTIIEAFAYKKVIIASKLGGPSETIKNNTDGILFDPENENELTEKFIKLIHKKDMCERMSQAGHKKYKLLFTPHVHYKNILKTYQKILNF